MSSEASRSTGTSRLDLQGKGLLITRPAAQISALKSLIEQSGGKAYALSALEITFTPQARLAPQLAQLRAEDILIFISQNAVKAVFNGLSTELKQQLQSTQIAVVGKRTEAALEQLGCAAMIQPDDEKQSTEGLLQHPDLKNIAGKRVFIARGQSGRELLFDTLQARGAELQYISAYQRAIPVRYDVKPILAALSKAEIDFVLANSFETFANLATMLAPSGPQALQAVLGEIQVIVPSERIAKTLRERYGLSILVADSAADEQMLAAASRASA